MSEQVLPMISCCLAVKLAFEKTCVFRGRARRSEFWFYFLFAHIIVFVPAIIYIILFFDWIKENVKNQNGLNESNEKITIRFPLIGFIILIVIVISMSVPLISLSVRRLHDTGKSGLFLFLFLIPIGGMIVLFIFLVEDSQRITNEYGPSIKYLNINPDPLLTNSMSVAENPYINPQVYPGNPMQYPYPNDTYQQYPQINQPPPQIIENEYIIGEQNQQIVKPRNLDIVEPKYIPTLDGQNLKIIDEQGNQVINLKENHVITLQDSQQINLQEDQVINLQDNQQINLQENQQINLQENQQIDGQQNKKEDY